MPTPNSLTEDARTAFWIARRPPGPVLRSLVALSGVWFDHASEAQRADYADAPPVGVLGHIVYCYADTK